MLLFNQKNPTTHKGRKSMFKVNKSPVASTAPDLSLCLLNLEGLFKDERGGKGCDVIVNDKLFFSSPEKAFWQWSQRTAHFKGRKSSIIIKADAIIVTDGRQKCYLVCLPLFSPCLAHWVLFLERHKTLRRLSKGNGFQRTEF